MAVASPSSDSAPGAGPSPAFEGASSLSSAGMSTVEPAAPEPFYTTLPGVNMKNLPPEKFDQLVYFLSNLQ